MTEVLPLVFAAVFAVITTLGLQRLFRHKAAPLAPTVPDLPPEPEHTSQELTDDQANEEPDAVDAAAADHDVDAGVVADLLGAADDVRSR